jgi:hypothetical protein
MLGDCVHAELRQDINQTAGVSSVLTLAFDGSTLDLVNEQDTSNVRPSRATYRPVDRHWFLLAGVECQKSGVEYSDLTSGS